MTASTLLRCGIAGLLLSGGSHLHAAELAITSPAFTHNGVIPAAHTCDGTSGNPALVFTGVPPGTASLAVIVDDPDVPWLLQSDGLFVHWIKWDLSPDVGKIDEGRAQGGIAEGGSQGYVQPCPPYGEHRYVFKLFALDKMLGPGVAVNSAEDLQRAMQGHVLSQAELVGRYRRPASTMIVPLVIFGVLLLILAGILYGVFRGVRFLIRRTG